MCVRGATSLLVGLVASLATVDARADDVQVWTGLGASIEPVEGLKLELEPELRLDENVSRVSELLVALGIQYRLLAWLRVGIGYRTEYRRDDDDDHLELRHRFHGDLKPRVDVGPLRVGYRLRLQEHWRPSSKDEARATLRNRMELAYRNWDTVTPEVSAEVFHGLGDFDLFEWSKIRMTIGASFEIGDHELTADYRIEVPLEDRSAATVHILGLSYHYSVSL